jgi:purine-binding chemotaxis protein CheW
MNKDSAAPPAGPGINWSEIHNRLETARQALDQDAALLSPQESRAILKARARLLAREPPPAATAQEFLEIIEFRLASETYGLESAFVREVYPLKALTPLPGVPPFVLGIANVRGQILSVIDLKTFFNLPSRELGQLNTLIILRNAQMEFGILADAVLGARSLALEAIHAAPPTVSGIGAEYLRGVTAERVILLDAEKILGDEKIIVHQEAE